MSHVSTVDVTITDLPELRRACESLGLELREGQKTWAWYGSWQRDYFTADAAVTQGFDPKQFGHGEHTIRVPGSKYEIGVVQRQDGKGLTLLYDNWGKEGRAISAKLGARCEKIVQRYNANRTTSVLRRRGHKVVERLATNGSIVLETM